MAAKLLQSVSLFSNCGAGDVGYARAGFCFNVMAELDSRRLEVSLLNHPQAVGVPGDLRQTWPQVVEKYCSITGYAPPALLAACPPCQGMSTARSDRGKETDPDAGMQDERNLLVTVIAEVVGELKPRSVVVENVQAFLTRQVRHPETSVPISAARLLIEELSEDYVVYPFVTDLCEYGVPQTRKRTFLTFLRRGESAITYLRDRRKTPYPIPRHCPERCRKPITVREALIVSGLPSLDASCSEKAISRLGGGLHAVPVWRDHRYDMVAAIPPHTGRSAWENDRCKRCGQVEVDEDAALCSRCGGPLLRPVVKTRRGTYRLITGFRHSTYRRMKSNATAAAITTASGHIGSNHTIHPYENRLLSTLECAILQTFPRGFQWGRALEEWGHTNVREMIGEAVPPRFTRLHGKVLFALLKGLGGVHLYPIDGSNCIRAAARLGLGKNWRPS